MKPKSDLVYLQTWTLAAIKSPVPMVMLAAQVLPADAHPNAESLQGLQIGIRPDHAAELVKELTVALGRLAERPPSSRH